MATKKTYFFGWNNIKKFITEMINIWSNRKSFFSKKRIESSLSFMIGQFGMVYYLVTHINNMPVNDLLIWAGIEFTIAGWTVWQIQKEKKTINQQPESTSDEESSVN